MRPRSLLHSLALSLAIATTAAFTSVPYISTRCRLRSNHQWCPIVISDDVLHINTVSPSPSLSTTSLGAASTIASALSTLSTTDIIRTTVGILLAQKISSSGYKKRSLHQSGAISAFIVASLSLACSIRSGVTLLAFYWTSSKLTRIGTTTKEKLEEGVTEGGERDAMQVFACSAIGVFCACLRRILVGRDGALLTGTSTTLSPALALLGDQLTFAYVAFFACCAGDTWASELGVLSKSLPRLIIAPWRKVPPGTNGGVSGVGLAASAAGGTLMGLLHGLFTPGGIASVLPFGKTTTKGAFGREIIALTFVGFLGGLGGSLLDSFLGATVQATYYDNYKKKIAKRAGPNTEKIGGWWTLLSNEMVNVVSTAISALLAALVARPILNWIV